jgi:uncharacterized surface protein with fasciclin (FAS1) repeats
VIHDELIVVSHYELHPVHKSYAGFSSTTLRSVKLLVPGSAVSDYETQEHHMKSVKRAVATLAIVTGLFSFGAPVRAADDIVDTAVKAGSFKTLVAAVQAAGLVDTLKSKGPFTVFAPTDEAFAKLPKGTVESLLKPENKKKLASILTYHVAPGRYDAARITSAKTKQFGLKSAQGSNIAVDLRKGVKVSGANVVKTDVAASNGVIHVIDSVILPPAKASAKHH